jgi:hypothetical protein
MNVQLPVKDSTMSVTYEPAPDAADQRPSPELEALFDSARTTHDVLWDAITAEDAPLVRRGLLRAGEIRRDGTDAGDAYLQGLAVGLAAHILIQHSAPGCGQKPEAAGRKLEKQGNLRLIITGGPDAAASAK